MDADRYFPSKWLNAEDIGDREVEAVIEDVSAEKIGEDDKLAVKFEGFNKQLILNKTNYHKLRAAFGPETTDWLKKKIRIYTALVSYKGEEVPAIRLKT